MRVVAITMVKDEIDIIEQSILNMLDQKVDTVLVFDNMSSDGTYELLQSLEKKYYPKVSVQTDSNVAYYQSEKMTRFANVAHEQYGAEWIIPFDADELWYAKDQPLADYLKSLDDIDIVYFHVWHMVATSDRPEADPLFNMTYRRCNPELFPVVAFRWHSEAVIAQGNHSVDRPGLVLHPNDNVGVKHYQYRSFRQFFSKVRNGKAAYDATNLPYGEGQHWREYGKMIKEDLFKDWNKMMKEEGLVYDPWS